MDQKPLSPRSRHLPTVFVTTAMALVATLAWLTWRLIEQDRALVNQRIAQRLEIAADAIIASLDARLAHTKHRLDELTKTPTLSASSVGNSYAKELGDKAQVFVATTDSFESFPADRLRYYPVLATSNQSDSAIFDRGEFYEFREEDYDKACKEFRKLASQHSASRAGALLRLGRVHRKRCERALAIEAYSELGLLNSEHVAGLPASLLAPYALCAMYDEENQPDDLERESRALLSDLHGGHWKLTQDAYLFYEQQTQRWLGQGASGRQSAADRQALALAAGAEWIWRRWQRIRRGEGASQESHMLRTYDIPQLLMWHATDEHMAALVVSPETVQQHWLGDVQPLLRRQGMVMSMIDLQGRPVVGEPAGKGQPKAVRTTAQTMLPCTLQVVNTDSSDVMAELAGRRHLLLTGLGITVLFVLAASYFIVCSVTRELDVARLQSSFVSAVSHEFRTPLASLRQLSELLADGRVSSDTRRGEYYEVLRRESDRLHRLVEGLLDFGRMEAGAHEYRFTSVDPAELVREVAEEFANEVRNLGYTVDVQAENSMSSVRGDRESLSRAVWNLLDNAVKYSSDCRTVWINTCRDGSNIAIRVRDRGLGIAPGEQREIFKKFFRSPSAIAAGLKGTGLGLAMVEQIVIAHSGTLKVDSRLGEGSTFRVLLPQLRDDV